MLEYPKISFFFQANKEGLVDILEEIFENTDDNGNFFGNKNHLYFPNIKTGMKFHGLSEICHVHFNDTGYLTNICFAFPNEAYNKILMIILDRNLDLVKTTFFICKTQEKYEFGELLDENILKILMSSKTGHRMFVEDMVPELHQIGVYDFNSDNFKQRIALANMVLI